MVYLKKKGAAQGCATGKDYVGIDLTTQKVIGRDKPTTEYRMHLACYRVRPDIKAVVHCHPPIATAVATRGIPLGYISYEFIATMNSDVPAIKYIRAGTKKLADAVKKVIKGHNGILLANHGILTVGRSMEEAYNRALVMERACKVLVIEKLLGKVGYMDKKEIEMYLKI